MSQKNPRDRDRKKDDAEGGVTRRTFLTAAGLGAAGAAAAGNLVSAQSPPAPAVSEADPELATTAVTLKINGRRHRVLVEPRWSLLFVLRERLGLTGTKVGCERGECGTCSVLIDDVPRYACMTLAVEAEGTAITTLEGLLDGEKLGPTQRAFAESDAFQCGYCTPGQIVAAEGLLRANPEPSDHEVRVGLSGNLCRCGAYPNIHRAVLRAGELRRRTGGAS
jgi:xanthine dehydrogenase YagT iron-sulfur-binding subunit